MSRFADEFVAESAGRMQLGFFAEALRFFGKAGFKGKGLFETSTLHDTTSCLRVLIRRVQQFQS